MSRYAEELRGGSAVGALTQLVLECGDADALAAFWRAVLDLPDATGHPTWRTLAWAPAGRFSFHQVEGYRPPPWPGAAGEWHAQ